MAAVFLSSSLSESKAGTDPKPRWPARLSELSRELVGEELFAPSDSITAETSPIFPVNGQLHDSHTKAPYRFRWMVTGSPGHQGRSGIALLVLAALCLAPAGDSESRLQGGTRVAHGRRLWNQTYVQTLIIYHL